MQKLCFFCFEALSTHARIQKRPLNDVVKWVVCSTSAFFMFCFVISKGTFKSTCCWWGGFLKKGTPFEPQQQLCNIGGRTVRILRGRGRLKIDSFSVQEGFREKPLFLLAEKKGQRAVSKFFLRAPEASWGRPCSIFEWFPCCFLIVSFLNMFEKVKFKIRTFGT